MNSIFPLTSGVQPTPLPASAQMMANTPVPPKTANSKLSSKARSYLFAKKPLAGGPQIIQQQRFSADKSRHPDKLMMVVSIQDKRQ